MKPLAIDLYCGLGGWTEGLLAEGYRVVGFDIEVHDYGDGKRYPSQLVIQDVLTIHGKQFKDASLIVASPPCQEFSYMAMPWSRAKSIAVEYRTGKRDTKKLTALFDACFRIQREAIEAAGHFIPLVVENVRGVQPWVGKADWHFGSYYLWGDVPALMPIPSKLRMKFPAHCGPRLWSDREYVQLNDGNASCFHQEGATKTVGHVNVRDGHIHTRHLTNPEKHSGYKSEGMNWSNRSIKGQDFTRIAGRHADGVKGFTPSGEPLGKNVLSRKHGSKSKSRKAASAAIAKIPMPLARWIAKVYKPK